MLAAPEVAARLGADVQTIRRWARTEQCPTIRVGHATRIPAAWIDELIARVLEMTRRSVNDLLDGPCGDLDADQARQLAGATG